MTPSHTVRIPEAQAGEEEDWQQSVTQTYQSATDLNGTYLSLSCSVFIAVHHPHDPYLKILKFSGSDSTIISFSALTQHSEEQLQPVISSTSNSRLYTSWKGFIMATHGLVRCIKLDFLNSVQFIFYITPNHNNSGIKELLKAFHEAGTPCSHPW